MARTRLSYGDFTRYDQNRYYSQSSNQFISVRQFQKLARGNVTYGQWKKQQVPPVPTTVPEKTKGGKKDYARKLDAYTKNINKQNKASGIPGEISKKQAMQDPTFKRLYVDYKQHRRDRDKSAKGELAHILVDLGLRDEHWTWDVGDTP